MFILNQILFFMKFLYIAFSCLISATTFAQNKRALAENPVTLAKYDAQNIEVEYKNKTIFVYYKNEAKKDTLFTAITQSKIIPGAFTLKPFTIKNKNLLLFSWNEKITTNADLKKEDVFIAENQIWDFSTKSRLAINRQKKVNTERIEYLSKHRDASQTIYSKRSEGKSFNLLPNGDFTLSSDKGIDKYVYNLSENKYKAVAKSAKTNLRRR